LAIYPNESGGAGEFSQASTTRKSGPLKLMLRLLKKVNYLRQPMLLLLKYQREGKLIWRRSGIY
jgi:hypothetical protein